jgi:hypothetical protein
MEWSDTPEKIENEKTDETPYVDTQARGVWICLQVLKIALEAVKSRINRRDQLWKSSNAWLVGGCNITSTYIYTVYLLHISAW